MTAAWPIADLPSGTDTDAVGKALADLANLPEAFGLSLATLVLHDGAIVAEQYGPTADVDTPLISWSMAKSFTQALVSICIDRGLLELKQPAPVAAWAGDERRHITIEHLLQMRSGLSWREEYVEAEGSDVIEMLFGSGMPDTAAFAASFPLTHPPGTNWLYSSGTTNILARIVGDVVGGGEAGFDAFVHEALLDPLGMSGSTLRYDPSGTFVGSSFVYSPARDFAGFGELYRRDGMWNGRQILSPVWCDRAGRDMPVAVAPAETYGYSDHWWTWGRAGFPGTFAAMGYEGQRIIVSPARRLVVVQLSKNPEENRLAVDGPLHRLLRAFPSKLEW
jgi:CubicO group peptidase (beta-lactamase class C family)